MRRTLIRYSAALACVGALAFSTNASARTFTILGGPVGGAWYSIAAGIANIVHTTYPNLDLKVLPGGGVANPSRVGSDSADFGISLTVPTLSALRGTKPYSEKYPDIRAIAFGFSTTYMHVVAPASFPYNTLQAAIKHHYAMKIASSSPATFNDWVTKQVLTLFGASPATIRSWGGALYQVSHSQQQDLLRNQQANVLISLLAIPAPDVVRVASVRKLKFLKLSNSMITKMVDEFGLQRATIPVAPYKELMGLKHPVHTVSMASGLIVSSKVPEKVVYEVTKALFEHVAQVQKIHPSMHDFIPANIVKPATRANGQIKLAAGAIKYFKQQGYDYK